MSWKSISEEYFKDIQAKEIPPVQNESMSKNDTQSVVYFKKGADRGVMLGDRTEGTRREVTVEAPGVQLIVTLEILKEVHRPILFIRNFSYARKLDHKWIII